jgi:hypothetical protein
MEALQQLLLFWVGSTCEVTSEWCKGLHKHGSSSSAAAADARPSSSGIGLAVALLERESQLLHAAAAAAAVCSSSSSSTGIKPVRTGAIARLQAAATAATASPIGSPRPGAFSTRQQQQQQQQYADDVEGDSPVTHASQLPEGGLVWGGNVTAVVSAVMTAVSQCSSTNQWAKLEQLLDAASAALTAAAAMQQQQQQQQAAASGSVNAAKSPDGEMATNGWDDDWEDGEADSWNQSRHPVSSSSAAAGGAGDAIKTQQQQQLELIRAAVLGHSHDLKGLAEKLSGLRGQVRAARLLTKHGCCVALGDLAAADSAAVKQMLIQLLARAERWVVVDWLLACVTKQFKILLHFRQLPSAISCSFNFSSLLIGSLLESDRLCHHCSDIVMACYDRLGASWQEAQWAQLWHDLLEAQQAGLSDRLPMSDMAEAFLRLLLLTEQYQLAVQFIPHAQQQQQQQQQQMLDAYSTAEEQQQQQSVWLDNMSAAAHRAAAETAAVEAAAAMAAGLQPSPAEAALAALTGSSRPGSIASSNNKFGVRKALHTAAGAAVTSSARLMTVSAGLVGTTAHLVGSTAQAVQSGTGGMVGATAGLVSGTASLVSTAAAMTAAAAAIAERELGHAGAAAAAAVQLRGASGALTAAAGERVVLEVGRELLASAISLQDPVIASAEAVLQLLPQSCQVSPSVT